jgi:hypothetical protein
MNMPLAGKHIGDVTRQYVARLGSIYDRAKSLLAGESHKTSGALESWKWYRASAQACMEEAAIIYTEGLESLIKVPLRVECRKQAGAPRFTCVLLDPSEGTEQPGFHVGRKLVMDTEAQRHAVETLLGSTDRAFVSALSEGLCKLQHLGAFKDQGSITLNPDTAPVRTSVTIQPEAISSHF